MNIKHAQPWSLQDLLPGGPQELDGLLQGVETCLSEFEAGRLLLTEGMPVAQFLRLLKLKERLHEMTAQVGAYAYLNYAGNTQDPAALSLQDRIDELLARVENRSLFFSLWFKNLPDEAAEPYISEAGDLANFLRATRRFKPYTLSEPEEKAINLKDVNGVEGLVKVYEIITNGFSFQLDIDGETTTLTRDGLNRYYHSPSGEVREATFKELYRVYGQHKTVLAQIYACLVRDWKAEAVELRGYASPISVRNLANHLPDAVVDTLLEVCRKNSGVFQRYFKLKARLLGMPRLRRCDIYAPMAQAEKTVAWHEALELVFDSFRRFSPQVAQAAARVLDENHLDSEIRTGKRGGAFSYSVSPAFTPWVLVNYTGSVRDVSTLAHELGHAVHSILASDHSVLNFHAPLPLAETASVFAEMLVTERLLSEEPDPAVQRDLLMAQLDNAYATVQRQAYISIFERDAHAKIAAGTTSEDLAQHYLAQLAEQFADAVELADEFAWEWLSIPHIYTSPFYPYAYSFGQLLVLALYQQYLNLGVEFLPRYLKLLSYGGSAEPEAILAEAGIDITSADFWQGGYHVLEGMLARLERIIGGTS
jgi:oligoendopeptidase F